MKKFKIKKGDNVVVITGKDKGKSGSVLTVLRSEDKVIVSGVNVVKKSVKANPPHQQGGFIQKELPIHISNVAMKCGDGHSKVGLRINEKTNAKERFLKKTGAAI